MTPAAWAVLGVVAAGLATLAATALLPRTWRERAAWRRITRANPDLERQFAAIWEDEIDRLAAEIGLTERRMGDCTEGGEP